MVTDSSLVDSAKTILELALPKMVRPAQRVPQVYGTRDLFWIRKGEWLDAYEFDDSRRLVLGIQRVAHAFGAQTWVCQAHGAEFSPCRDTQAVAVTPEVLDGEPRVEGTRYGDMGAGHGGWIIIHDKFQGHVTDLEQIHIHTLVQARPDLERYFALPSGWSFFTTPEGENIYRPESEPSGSLPD